jgi:hypothetical protein
LLDTDSFDSFNGTDNGVEVILDRTNIAWDTDRTVRFRNPGGEDSISPEDLEGTTQPPNWPKDLSEISGGLQNESLMVWFRVSAFPWFRKLYARPMVNGDENTMLPRGDYTIVLTYSILECGEREGQHLKGSVPFTSILEYIRIGPSKKEPKLW